MLFSLVVAVVEFYALRDHATSTSQAPRVLAAGSRAQPAPPPPVGSPAREQGGKEWPGSPASQPWEPRARSVRASAERPVRTSPDHDQRSAALARALRRGRQLGSPKPPTVL